MPRRWHGPTIATNLVNLCPNAHRDVHTMLTALLNGRPVDRRDFGPIVRQLADRGYREVMASAQQLADAHKATQAGERS